VMEGPHPLPDEDYEVGQRLQGILGEAGINFLTTAQLKSAQRIGEAVRAVVQQRKGETEIEVDRVLWAGQRPLIEGLGLEAAEIRTEDGAVSVDATGRTSVPHIFAIGDLTGDPMYSYMATVQGLVAAENAMGRARRLDLKAMPRCVYTIPEAACVGLSEDDAMDAGYDVEVANISLATSARGLTLNEPAGGIKVVFERELGKLVGVHIVGHRATELISEAALALQLEALAEDFAWALRGHPTLSEGMLEAGRSFFGQALYIPKW